MRRLLTKLLLVCLLPVTLLLTGQAMASPSTVDTNAAVQHDNTHGMHPGAQHHEADRGDLSQPGHAPSGDVTADHNHGAGCGGCLMMCGAAVLAATAAVVPAGPDEIRLQATPVGFRSALQGRDDRPPIAVA